MLDWCWRVDVRSKTPVGGSSCFSLLFRLNSSYWLFEIRIVQIEGYSDYKLI